MVCQRTLMATLGDLYCMRTLSLFAFFPARSIVPVVIRPGYKRQALLVLIPMPSRFGPALVAASGRPRRTDSSVAWCECLAFCSAKMTIIGL
jgi:hypothetical protein